MKRDKSRLARACIKYIAPSVVLIAPHAAASPNPRGPSCKPYYCFSAICGTSSSTYACAKLISFKMVPKRKTVGTPPGNYKHSITSYHNGDKGVCVNTKSIAVQNTKIDTKCTGMIHPNGGVRAQMDPPPLRGTIRRNSNMPTIARAINYLTAYINAYRPSIRPPSGPEANAHKLAKITIHLAITELNNVPGGLHINPGEPITVSQLTEEQRTVLTNHRGLIREALRQLKAVKAEESTPVPG